MSSSFALLHGVRSARASAVRHARRRANAPATPSPPATQLLTRDTGLRTFNTRGSRSLQADKTLSEDNASPSSLSDHGVKRDRETKNGAQPKFNTEPESGNSAEVEQHNRELEKRKERNGAKGGGSEPTEKVEKGFWSGEGKGAANKDNP